MLTQFVLAYLFSTYKGIADVSFFFSFLHLLILTMDGKVACNEFKKNEQGSIARTKDW